MSTITRDSDGNALMDDGFRMLRGNFPGVRWLNKFGHNAAAAAGDAVWSPGLAIPDMHNGLAGTLNVKSTSVEDDVLTAGAIAGTGAWTVEIFGLDTNYDELVETVTLNGTADVETVGEFNWINTAKVRTAASHVGCAGTITMTSTATGTQLLGQIDPGENTTATAQFAVPAGHTAYLRLPQISLQNTGNNTLMDLQLINRKFNAVDVLMFDVLLQAGANTDYQQKDFTAPLQFNEKDLIYWKVKSVAGGGVFNLIVDYDIWLFDNSIQRHYIATGV